jgi:hypothetical protein
VLLRNVCSRKERAMYGTIARFRLKSGTEAQVDELIRTMRSYGSEAIPGMIDEWIYRSDEDPRTWYMAVLFESRESYVKNAVSPEQDQRYRHFRDLLEADPEWHDGEILYAFAQRRSSTRRAAA